MILTGYERLRFGMINVLIKVNKRERRKKMRKSYCTQNNGTCSTCSLVNYGMDCSNNPIGNNHPRGTRSSRMMAAYTGHHGPVTVEAVLAQIPVELGQKLTGRQLGLVMSAINAAYHNGRASTGAELLEE
jgi:hypothetical protein